MRGEVAPPETSAPGAESGPQAAGTLRLLAVADAESVLQAALALLRAAPTRALRACERQEVLGVCAELRGTPQERPLR